MINFKPSPRQTLALFSMVFAHRDSDVRPDMKTLGLKPSERTQLVQQRLIELEKASRGHRAQVTELGWAWVADNLSATLDRKSPAGKTLAGLLVHLDKYLRAHNTALPEFVLTPFDRDTPRPKPGKRTVSSARKRPKAKARKKPVSKPARRGKRAGVSEPAVVRRKVDTKAGRSTPRKVGSATLAKRSGTVDFQPPENTNATKDVENDLAVRIRSEALAITRGAARTRVRLRDLRARLGDLSREQVDRGLFALAKQGGLVLYRIDDANDLNDEDKRAAVMVAGNPRHVVYLEK